MAANEDRFHLPLRFDAGDLSKAQRFTAEALKLSQLWEMIQLISEPTDVFQLVEMVNSANNHLDQISRILNELEKLTSDGQALEVIADLYPNGVRFGKERAICFSKLVTERSKLIYKVITYEQTPDELRKFFPCEAETSAQMAESPEIAAFAKKRRRLDVAGFALGSDDEVTELRLAMEREKLLLASWIRNKGSLFLTGSDSEEKPDYVHPRGSQVPESFCFEGDPARPYGPVTGSKTELGACCGYASEGAGKRRLRDALKEAATEREPRIWLRESKGRDFEAYFRGFRERDEAKGALENYRERNPKEPNGTERNREEP